MQNLKLKLLNLNIRGYKIDSPTDYPSVLKIKANIHIIKKYSFSFRNDNDINEKIQSLVL